MSSGHSESTSSPPPTGFGAFDAVMSALPVALAGALALLYAVAPEFYLEYVLEYRSREGQAVEIITTTCGGIAVALLAWSAWRIWKDGVSSFPPPPSAPALGNAWNMLHGRGGAFIIGVIALAAFFFVGEEMSWGQTYLRWESPERLRETNLHNNVPISVQGLGSAFLAVCFFGLPALWALRRRLPFSLPADWAPAVPELPVVVCMAVAFGVAMIKSIYLRTGGNRESLHYVQYIEQLKEQKEMFAAITLLMYGIYRVRYVRRMRRSR